MIDRRSMLSAIVATALLPPSITMTSPAAAQGTNRVERLWTGFSSPVGMAFDKSGNLYVAEWGAGRVSRIEPDGKRTTFAGDLSGPSGLAIDAEGNIYVASYSRDEIHRFISDGSRETWLTGLATPAGLGFDRTGRLAQMPRRWPRELKEESTTWMRSHRAIWRW